MTARIIMGRVRYDAASGSGSAPGAGHIRLMSGDQVDDLQFDQLQHGARTEPLEHDGLTFNGSVYVKAWTSGSMIGSVTFDESPEQGTASPGAGSWRYTSVEANGHRFTFSFEISRAPRENVAVTSGQVAPVQQCEVAPNQQNCIAPAENCLAFAPRYNRAQLVNASNSRVSDAARRSAYAAAIETGGDWRGPLTIFAGSTNEEVLHIKEPADSSGAFVNGADAFLRYWHQAPARLIRIDNGRDNRALGGRHVGEGDHIGYHARLTEMVGAINDFGARVGSGDEQLLSSVAFFCHGWRRGFQLGILNYRQGQGASDFQDLITALKSVSRDDVVICLYCCATAQAPQDGNNFAAAFAKALIDPPQPRPFARVFGHLHVAHSWGTPGIMIFDADHPTGVALDPATAQSAGGVTYRSRYARYAAHNPRVHDHSGFRWAFPFMSVDSAHAFLAMDDPPEGAFDE